MTGCFVYYRARFLEVSVEGERSTVPLSLRELPGISRGNSSEKKSDYRARWHWVKYNSKRNAKAVVTGRGGISFHPWISVLFRGTLPFAYSTPASPTSHPRPAAFFYYSNGIPPLQSFRGIYGCFSVRLFAVINGQISLTRAPLPYPLRINRANITLLILNRVSINANRCGTLR